MHAAYIEAESRLKRHRGAGPDSPRENRIETRVCYDIVRRVEREGGEGEEGRRCSSGVACLELVLSGRPSPPKDRKVDFIKRIYGSIVLLPGRMRAAGTAF